MGAETRRGHDLLYDRIGAWLVPVLLFAGLVGYLLFAERALLFGPLVLPMGDAAADDLLVQQAQHLRLLHGNYSRFGFYHPGPWFLYVAALGEDLFYRWTGLFNSYLGAQTFALSLTQAIAFAVACRLWGLVSGRPLFGALAVAIIAACIVSPLAPANPFVQLWTPYSTIASSLLAATGLAGCILRGSSWLPLLVLGSAQMVNGHASFLGIVPMILGLAALLLGIVHRPALRLSTLSAWIAGNRLPVCLSVAIAAFYAAPILLQTILHWPGELAQYWHFIGALPPQRLAGAWHTVLGFIPAAGVWLLLLLLPATSQARRQAAGLRTAALVVFFPAALPALWYAWREIDDLANLYLLIWLAPFVGTACVAAMLHAVSASRLGLSPKLALYVVVTTLAVKAISNTAPWSPVDTRANVSFRRGLADLLRLPPAPGGGRTELFLDVSAAEWPLVWPETVAVLAGFRRAGRDDLCVSPMTWNLLFGIRERCDPAHDHIAKRLVVTGWDRTGARPAVRLDRAGIMRQAGLRLGVAYSVEDALVAGLTLEQGWSAITPDGVWTEGAQALLAFPSTGLPAAVHLVLSGTLLAPHGGPQIVQVRDAGGHLLAVMRGPSGPVSARVAIGVDAARIRLTLRVMHPVTPRSLGIGGDTRRLGFMLSRLALVR
ncbi:hypothetical protein [Lichenicoccus sp.]|uniref:hypothetical protein n=1 Tax=Lichenicoccus sp. TaxID=2781899 RepID=UPI003D0F1C22